MVDNDRATEPTAHPRLLRGLTLVALVGFAWWFFGNLYESIVISPNWIVDSPQQLERLNEFFVNSSPTTYFIPVSPLSLMLLWVAAYLARNHASRAIFTRAVVASAVLGALTVVIVAVLVTGLFGEHYAAHPAQLNAYARWWNVANLVRMVLTATTLVYVWRAYRVLDRSAVPSRVPPSR